MTNGAIELLTPQNSVVLFIDHQPQMAFGVVNIDRQLLKNNVVALARASKAFAVPTFLTTVETDSFSGPMWPELLDVFPETDLIERTSMNSWDDARVRKAVAGSGRKKLILSGLWTEVCINLCAFSAMADGYQVYVVEDACGGTSEVAHRAAMDRMIQAGVRPLTWQQTMLEWQRDWAHRGTYDAVTAIVKEHSGAYGMGIDYAYTMVHKAAPRTASKGKVLKAAAE